MKRGLIAVVALGCALVGCGGLPDGVRSSLANADSMTLFRLDPYPSEKSDKDGESLQGHRILGQAKVTDAAERAKIAGVLDSQAGKGTPAKCFNPRHAVVSTKGAERVEVLICFECSQMYIYRGAGEPQRLTVGADGSALDERFDALGLRVVK